MKQLFALCAAALLFTAAHAQSPQAQSTGAKSATTVPTSDLGKKVDTLLERAIAEGRLVGAVVLVSRDGKLIYKSAAGLADKQSRKPMQIDTLFRLASVSKPIASTAALVLVDQGKLGLDEPVTKWLPSFKPKLADGTTPTITVRQLLTHTAGLGYKFTEENANGPYHVAKISDGIDDSHIDLAEEVRRLGSVPLLNAPGSEWRYSLSIDVLGAVIAAASGQSFDAALATLVTKPLQMSHTSFWVESSDASRLAAPYLNSPSGPELMTEPQAVESLVFSPARAFDKKAYPSGGGGMIGTATDVWQLLETVRKGGAPILKTSTAAAMMSNQIGTTKGMGPGAGFGFGGAVVVDPKAANTPQSRGTWSWGGVYGHSWFVDPARRVTVVALTNTTFEGMSGKFPTALRDAVCETIKP